MGVALYHSTAGTLSLPWPAHNQPVTTVKNQEEKRSGSGALVAINRGPVRYQIERTFESLTDDDVQELVEFLEEIDFAGSDIEYQYAPHGDDARFVTCRIIEEIQKTRVFRNRWDVTLKFEQTNHPDRMSDPTLAAPEDLLATANAD